MKDEQGHPVMCSVDLEELQMILTQVSYMCDRLAVELPRVEGEIDAVDRANILSRMIERWLGGNGLYPDEQTTCNNMRVLTRDDWQEVK